MNELYPFLCLVKVGHHVYQVIIVESVLRVVQLKSEREIREGGREGEGQTDTQTNRELGRQGETSQGVLHGAMGGNGRLKSHRRRRYFRCHLSQNRHAHQLHTVPDAHSSDDGATNPWQTRW